MAKKNNNIWYIVGGVVIAILVIWIILANVNKSVVCNAPYIQVGDSCCLDENSNGICDSDELPTQNQEISEPEEKKISVSELIDFVKSEIKNNFPSSSGAFVKFGDLEEQKAKGYGCFTGFPNPCNSWHYPGQEDLPAGEPQVIIMDFGEGDAPPFNQALSDHSFPDIEKKTLSNGNIIYQYYEDHPEEGLHGQHIYVLNINVPCLDRYWVELSEIRYKYDNEQAQEEWGFDEPLPKNKYLDLAEKILGYCK